MEGRQRDRQRMNRPQAIRNGASCLAQEEEWGVIRKKAYTDIVRVYDGRQTSHNLIYQNRKSRKGQTNTVVPLQCCRSVIDLLASTKFAGSKGRDTCVPKRTAILFVLVALEFVWKGELPPAPARWRQGMMGADCLTYLSLVQVSMLERRVGGDRLPTACPVSRTVKPYSWLTTESE